MMTHSFQHVTDVTSSAMKAIVGHLSGPKGARATLAVLDGITSAIVVNTWRPDASQMDMSKHKWSSNTYLTYKAILEQLEKYWVLAIAHTSTRTVPPNSLEAMAERLKHLSRLAHNEVAGGNPPMSHVPLTHAISACERGWTHPAVVAILEGQCTDRAQIEPQTLQRARLHVLERTQRWQQAFHYAMFHGHMAKSLAYLVRAGRSNDVLPMVQRQTSLASGAQCVPVCAELVQSGHPDTAVRLAMYCAFGEYAGVDQNGLQSRQAYIQWLVEHVVTRLDQQEAQSRNLHGPASGVVESARRDAEEWARQAIGHLGQVLLNPLSEPPLGSLYSQAAYDVERVAALCPIVTPSLAVHCAKMMNRGGEMCGAVSVVLVAGSTADAALISWTVQELLPKVGTAALLPAVQLWPTDSVPVHTQMALANALASNGEQQEAMRWANSANIAQQQQQQQQQQMMMMQQQQHMQQQQQQQYQPHAMPHAGGSMNHPGGATPSSSTNASNNSSGNAGNHATNNNKCMMMMSNTPHSGEDSALDEISNMQ